MSPLLTTMVNYMNNSGVGLSVFPNLGLSFTASAEGANHHHGIIGGQKSSSPENITMTATNSTSSSSPSIISPQVLNFSRAIDLFFNEKEDAGSSKSSSNNVKFSNLAQSRPTDSSSELVQLSPEAQIFANREEGSGVKSTQHKIQVIDWHMLDKWKFYPLSMLSSFTIRCCLYPFTVVKTCIQLQQRNTVYTSMHDAYRKIYAAEGIGGLYKGFWVSTFQIVSGVGYVSTYEGVRHILKSNSIIDNNSVRSLIAGGCASVVGQTFLVPFDVVSQHLMVLGKTIGAQNVGSQTMVLNPLNINYEGRSKFQITTDITKEIYRRDGLRGYYRGYFASLGTYVPNSALWWSFYHIYQEKLVKVMPANTSHLLVQCFAGTLGGFTTTILTNPLDVCRARLQVQRLDSFPKTFTILWAEEGLAIFTKGLSARLTQSAIFSFAIILGYETIKRFSVNEEYKDRVKW